MLSEQQIETYRRDGYLVIPRLIQGEQLGQLRALTDRIVDEARDVAVNDELYDLEPSHSATLPRVRRLKPAIFKRYAFFHALARDPASRRATALRSSGTRIGHSIHTPTTTCWRPASISTTATSTTAR